MSDAQSNSGTVEEVSPNRFEIKENSRQSRRQKRRQARLGTMEATEESSDEPRQIIAGRRVPRDLVERLAAVINFLGSYNNDVEKRVRSR
jgi:hypothetical protein